MTYRDIVKAQLRVDEGVRYLPYQDTAGVLTIGIGHNLRDVPLSEQAVAVIFSDDLAAAEIAARRLVPNFDALTDNRKAVVLNMAFNLGYTKLSSFKATLSYIVTGQWDKAAAGMRASLWARQVGDRAERLAVLMEKG